MSQICVVCMKPAVQSCSACNSTYYCSREHQKINWKHHKSSCAPFKIVCDESGKSLVAIRNIEPGEKIFTKLPVLTGPQSERDLICVNCYKKTDPNSKKHTCKICGLNVCAKSCGNKDHLELCEVLQSKGLTLEKFPKIYLFLLPLKILLLKTSDFKKFDIIMSNFYYDKTENQQKTLDDLMKFCETLDISTSEEELLKVYVISKRNFIDITLNKLNNTKGFYPLVPLLKPNCKPNTKRVFTEDAFQLSVFATTPIKKGDVLTMNFTDPLWGTLERQSYLKTSKFISCTCDRCKDPKEFDTYVGSIFCQKCKDKLLEDDTPKIISDAPLELQAEWKCEKCGNKTPAKQISFGNKSLGREIQGQNMDQPKCLEHFLFKYGEILHPMNSFCLRVKFKLVQLYGNAENFKLTELPQELLERKIQLCHELLDISDTLTPGFSRLRGILLYELQAAMVIQSKNNFCKELITKSEAEDNLRRSLDILRDACKILIIEPEFKETLQEKLESLVKMLQL